MDIKLIANVGWHNGGGSGGVGMLYAAKTPGGTIFFVINFTNDGNKWKYYPLSSVQNLMQGGFAQIAADLKTELFSNIEKPDFVDAADRSSGFYTVPNVINATGLAVKWNGEDAYTVKGEGIADSDVTPLKKGSGTGTGTGTNTGTNPPPANTGALGGFFPSDFSTLFSNPIKFIQDNALFVVAVLAVIYWVRRKKKKPLWLF